MFDLDRALSDTIKVGASDLHLKVPSRPRIRVAGELIDLPGREPFSTDDALAVKEQVLTSPIKLSQLQKSGSADLSYYTDEGRFRVSVFSQRGSAAFAFRVVPTAPEAGNLGLPEVVISWADAIRGLIVITGPTGAGKSTTSAAILDLINSRRSCHILTIEDPIEYLHTDRRAIICQREVGLDAPTYHVALRAALRQDPDVIMIGEIRDEETAMTALRAAETGHLVVCTMHTIDAAETIRRFVELFGERQAGLARQVLATTLVGVCSQRLIPATSGGMTLNSEVLVNTARVRDMILANVAHPELHTAIAEGDYYGMRTFDQCLTEKVDSGKVEAMAAIDYATNPHDLKLRLEQAGLVEGTVSRLRESSGTTVDLGGSVSDAGSTPAG